MSWCRYLGKAISRQKNKEIQRCDKQMSLNYDTNLPITSRLNASSGSSSFSVVLGGLFPRFFASLGYYINKSRFTINSVKLSRLPAEMRNRCMKKSSSRRRDGSYPKFKITH